MRIAVAGGTGVVGAHAARLAEAAGHEVRVLARSRGVDLVTGAGLDLAGVDVVIDASGPSASSAAKSRAFFAAVTARLREAERAAGVGHHIALSIVGAAGAPHGYYAGKAHQERLVASGDVPWSILRATQFFEFALQQAIPLAGALILPAVRSQPIAAASVAGRLLELAELGPVGEDADLAGPEALRIAEVARAVIAARGGRRRVVEVPLPGAFGRALRDGSILPGPDARLVGPSLDEWLRREHGESGESGGAPA